MNPVAPQEIFANEESVLKTLVVIRNSTVPPEDKAYLRDLFLDYAGELDEGKKAKLKEAITKKIAEHSSALPTLAIRKDNEQNNDPLLKTSALGISRPTPKFSQPTNTIQNLDRQPEVNTQVTTPTPITTESEVATAEPIKKEVAEPLKEEISTTEVISAPATDLKSRIDEIKKDINSRVGNPVNIIEADETIGREYMSSLLDAMKSVSGGGNEPAAAARLEKAYKAALTVVDKISTKEKTTTQPETNTIDIQSSKEDTSLNNQPTTFEEIPPPPLEVVASNQKVEEKIQPPAEEEGLKSINQVASAPNSTGLYHQPIDEVESAKANQSRSLAELINPWKKPEKDSAEEIYDVSPQIKASPSVRHLNIDSENSNKKVTANDSGALKSLKDSAALPEKIKKLEEEAAKREEESKKPITDLNSPEVQAGLEKLLSEWSLFRSSGFLGTGPSGINHPLYKKLANMPMASVIAGRFEGYNPQIKQTITDYMNGWRYEQGIIHEMGETFEHYLRRVIKQILTRQRILPSSK